jgi:hypothetical protein
MRTSTMAYRCTLAVLLLSCAAGPAQARRSKETAPPVDHSAVAQRWIGRSVDELLVTYGAPHKTLDLPAGGKLLSFAGTEETGPSRIGSFLFGAQGSILDTDGKSYRCVVNFAIDTEGMVTNARVQIRQGRGRVDPCASLVQAP